MLFQSANKIFQKWTIFVFTDSWSRDQVMQRAYHVARNFCGSQEPSIDNIFVFIEYVQ